jgi:hypothetical protein
MPQQSPGSLDHGDSFEPLLHWPGGEPLDALRTQQLSSSRRRQSHEDASLLEDRGLFAQGLIGVAKDAGPAKLTDAVDDFHRVRAAKRQVAAVQHQVGMNLLEVCEDGLERRKVAMNVGNDRDSHRRHATAARNAKSA